MTTEDIRGFCRQLHRFAVWPGSSERPNRSYEGQITIEKNVIPSGLCTWQSSALGRTLHLATLSQVRGRPRMNKARIMGLALWILRLALAAGFLSAVADRFGLWGPPGAPNVAWGDWQSFVEYVAVLNWFVPEPIIPALAWAATLGELLVAMGLLIGWQLRWVALAGGLLLLSFALTMAMALGIKAALDFSVFGVAAGAFLLAAISGERSR